MAMLLSCITHIQSNGDLIKLVPTFYSSVYPNQSEQILE